MTSARELLRPPRPWHLVLAPIPPLVAFLKDTLIVMPPSVIFMPVAMAVALTVVFALLVVPLGKDRDRSAFAVSMIVITGVSFITIARGVLLTGAGSVVIAVIYAAVWIAALLLFRSRRPAPALTEFANRATVLALAFLLVPIAWSEWRRPRTIVEAIAIPTGTQSGRPDVYVIVLDGYGREDVLREVYGLENRLPEELRMHGFFVADRATANYAQTALSLASALNADYVPALKPRMRHQMDRRGLGDLIGDSRFFRAFAAAGYRIRAYSSEYALVHPRPAHERPSPALHLNDFSYTAYETTLIPTLLDAAGLQRGFVPMILHRHHVTWTLKHLATTPLDESQPMLVFAHLLAPHPPFAFAPDGGARVTRMPALLSDADHWRSIAKRTGESYKSGYVDAVRVLNVRLMEALQGILAHSRRPFIVLIHGDHGPGAGLEWDNPDGSDLRERMGILLALRFPNGEALSIPVTMTPVNAYRSVLNRALGTNLPALEDRSFFSTWLDPYAYIDTTARLHAVGGERTAAGNR